MIQTQSENYGGGTDIIINRYDFTGKNICTYTAHNNKQASPGDISIITGMDYDHTGRLLRIWKTVNDQDDQKTRIVNNAYDELGMLQVKELGRKRLADGNYSLLPLEKLHHTYNIRGWLKGINASYSNPALSAGMSQEHWFGMELNYDWGSEPGKNQFNGNISSATWKSKGVGISRAYGFSYDKANRLLGGDFSEYNGIAYTDNATVNFDMVMGNGKDATSAYDANGNIRTMDQWGMKLNTSVLMDKLSYRYKNGGHSNRLSAVSDSSPLGSVDNKLGDFIDKPENGGQVSEDYDYDVNGNLLYDKNKNIRSILYNHLNLPQTIIVTNNDGTDKGKITYTYDASGNKLQKKVSEYAGSANNNQQKETTTIYVGDFVYEQSGQDPVRLQHISHEEGRIRIKSSGAQITWNYDYFIKDHLGNIRMVLTDEQEQAGYPVASLEEASLENEKKFYTIPDQGSRVHKSNVPGYPEGDSYTNPNNYIQKLNGNGVKVGTGIVLKVMSGDKVNIRASSWYKQNGVAPGSPQSIVEDIVASLSAGLSGGAAGKAGLPLHEPAVLLLGVAAFLDHAATNTANTIKPKAYLNWLLLDEQLKPVITGDGKNSGFEQAGPDQAFTIYQLTGRELTKNGYLYIYLSNATPNIDVFFDNLQVTHIKGSLLEETHYYPFGLTMAGISSRAAVGLPNKKGFNSNELQSKEFSDGSGLELYDFNARTYDQQIGRFIQVDPLLEEDGQESISPYHFSYNNPLRYSDADGKAPDDIVIRGSNNSSVTIKTDLIDVDVNAGSLGVDFGGNYDLQGGDLLSAALDIVGIFDPTGIADGINAKLSADKENWGDMIISGLGTISYIGDMAKVGKIGKDVKIIKNAVEKVSSGRKQITKVLPTRKAALDARPKPKLAKAGDKKVTRQSRNKSGEGKKFKTDRGSQTPHVHDRNHNDKSKSNIHYRVGTKKIKP